MNKSKTITVKLSTYTFMMDEMARLTELNRRLERKLQEQAREVMELLSVTPTPPGSPSAMIVEEKIAQASTTRREEEPQHSSNP